MTQPKNAEHETAAPVGTMDLNNPPKEPYHFEQYPRVMYKAKPLKDDKTAPVEYDNVTVQNEKEEKEHLAKGWKTTPPEPEPEPKAEHIGPKK